jgi:diguanylate cyclase (GGDEF)-like protein
MLDIDEFKLYNDHYGHQAGDACLQRVASALKDTLRQGSDLVARYGGEEFVIILPAADLNAACRVAERARAAVEALNEPHKESQHGFVTISVGAATLIPGAEGSPALLLSHADTALYRAKHEGRNRMATYSPE